MTEKEFLSLGNELKINGEVSQKLWKAFAAAQAKNLEEYEAAKAETEEIKRQLEEQRGNAEQTVQRYEAEINRLKLRSGVEKALIAAGARNLKAVGCLIDEEKISFDGEGNLEGLEQQIEAVKQSDPYLFKDVEEPHKSEAVGLVSYIPEEDIDEEAEEADFSQMTYSQITEYLAENKN